MAGTNPGTCALCECDIDYDPLLGGKQYCDDCNPEYNNSNKPKLYDEE